MENKIINRQEIIDKVIDLFFPFILREDEFINEDSVLSDTFPLMDHLDRISIIMDLENEFEVIIYDDDIIDRQKENDFSFNFKLNTIKQIVDLVLEKLNAKAGKLNLEISE